MGTPRLKIVGEAAFYHCISRACAGRFVFGDVEKEQLRRMLGRVAAFCGVDVVTYTMMSNHFHVLVRVPHVEGRVDDEILVERVGAFYGAEAARNLRLAFRNREDPEYLRRAELLRERLGDRMHDVSEFMKMFKQGFSIWFNRRHDSFGTVWAERFKSVLVENKAEALSTVAAYIDLNAVRAGLCEDPAHYRHCGYAEASAGGRMAQKGLALALGWEGAESPLEPKGCWEAALADYRVRVFGEGSTRGGGKSSCRIDSDLAQRVLESGGCLPMAERLRLKVRYFTEGLAIGSREFLAGITKKGIRRRPASPRTLQSSYPMEGAEWGSLRTLRLPRELGRTFGEGH